MSFNVNMKQPPKPKINMRDKGSITDSIGMDGNALSQKPKEVTDVEFGNSVRDKILQKQIEAIRNDVNVRVDNIENQVENISISTEQLNDRVDSLDTKVNQLEGEVEHIEEHIDEKINVEKEARIEADNQLQESINEIDEKIEHLDKYAEKTTTVGGVSLEQSTDSLNTYKYRVPDGFKTIIEWSTFADVENEYIVYGEEESLDITASDEESSNLSFPIIAVMKYHLSETFSFTAIAVTESREIQYIMSNTAVEVPANTWCKLDMSTQSITFEVPSKFEIDESLIKNEEYFNAIYNKEPSLINLEDKVDSIENSVQQQGSLFTQFMSLIESKFLDYDNDIEQLQDNLDNEEGVRQAQDEILQQNIDNLSNDLSQDISDINETLNTPLKSWIYDKQGITMQPVFDPIAEPQIIGTMIGTAQAICGESSATKTIYKDTDNNITINISYSSGSTRRLYITYLVDEYEYKNTITGTLDMSTYQYNYYSSWQQISPTVKPISSQDDLPILPYSNDYIYDSNVEAVKAFLRYEANVHDNTTLMSDVIDNINQDILDESLARQQADANEVITRNTNDNSLAGAISDRLCIVKMDNVVLNNWTDVGIPQEFENYSYVAVIRDTRIIGAESVNVLFTIEQILSDNYCPAPLVDNVEGTIKIFGNDNMTITIPSIEIFKPITFTLNNGGE